ncbi:MAG: hypothetical protein IT373_19130 [Polyangiaceae bacterium]|nr:hypothetical protein [Polyangiaceae bacterium]
MRMRKVLVAAHGHCFDGLASAVAFTHLRSHLDPRPVQFRYRSCGYGPTMQTVPETWLSCDENAIVDFRYTPSDRVTWYFDHHVTAFASDAERETAHAEGRRCFFDPAYGSCTKLIADVGRARFGVGFDAFAELVDWADKIDTARFASAAEAIDRTDPVMQLGAVIEQHGNVELYSMLVPLLLERPPAEVGRDGAVQALWAPLAQAHRACLARMQARAERRGEVVFVDLNEAVLETSGKFLAYSLVPDARYSVSLVRMKQHFKVSVGYNPWCGRARAHDIAALCRRYGGGGHAVVGAVSVAIDDLAGAQRIASELVSELNR